MGRSKEPAGAIFMCSSLTKGDCLQYKVLGLPMAKKHLVDKIVPGTKLFMFDFDAKLLHGVFEAVTHGGLNLVPEAYQDCAGSYPAQVRFEVVRECLPVSEEVLKDTIKDNYYNANKFNYELTEDQVNRLVQVFCPVEPARKKGRGDDRQGASRSVFSRLSGAGKKLQSGGKPYDHKEPRAARYGSPELVHPPRKKDKKHIEEDHNHVLLRRSGSTDIFPLNPKLREVAYPSPRRNRIGESDRPRRYVSDHFNVQESGYHSLPPRPYAKELEHFDAFPGEERGPEEFIKTGHLLREEFLPYRDYRHLPKRPIDDEYFADLPRREPVHNRDYGGHLPRDVVDKRSHGQFIKRVQSPSEIEFEDDGHYYERSPRRESMDNRDYGYRPRREPMDTRKFAHLPRKEPLDDRDYGRLEKRPGSLMRREFEDDEHYSRRLPPTRETVDDVNNGCSSRRLVSLGKRELAEEFNGQLPRRSSSLMKRNVIDDEDNANRYRLEHLPQYGSPSEREFAKDKDQYGMKRKLIDDEDKDNRHRFEHLPQYGSPSEKEFAKDKDQYGPLPRRPASLLKRDFVGDEEYLEHLSRRPRSYVVLQQQDVQRPSDDYLWPSTAELLQSSHIEEIDQLALRYMQPPDHFPDVTADTVLSKVHKWSQ